MSVFTKASSLFMDSSEALTNNTESSQAMFRVVVLTIFTMFFAVDEQDHLQMMVMFAATSFLWYFWVIIRPANELRKYLSIVLDCILISTAIYNLGPAHVPPYLMYFWVIIGYGYRFGSRFALAGVVISMVTFWGVVLNSPLWVEKIFESVEMTISYLVVAVFAYRILYNLELKISEASHFEYKSLTDPLTGLFNREFSSNWLNTKEKAGVIFIDLDNFKYYNDTFGHEVGDEVLVDISEKLKRCVRAEDFVCRYAGDEFVVLIDTDDRDIIQGIGDRIKDSLNKDMVSSAGEHLTITGSAGIAVLGVDANNADDVIQQSDRAMYQAKRLGRNQLVWAS